MGWFKHLTHSALQLNPVTVGHNLVTGAGGLFGGSGHNQLGAINADYNSAQSSLGMGQAEADTERRRALGETRGAFANARGSLTTGRTQAIQSATDAGAQQTAQAGQSLASRGLYNTTVLDNARQGISSNTSRVMADIDAHYAQILASLGVQEAAATTGIRQGIAGGAQAYGQNKASLYTNHANMLSQIQEQDPNAWLGSLMNLAGTGLGYAIGGPAGAAVGGAVGGGGGPSHIPGGSGMSNWFPTYPQQYGPQP